MINSEAGIYIGGIVATSILIATLVALIPFLYSYATYTKARLFTKPKLYVVVIVIAAIMFALLLTIGIFLATYKVSDDPTKAQYFKTHAALLITASILMALDLAAYIAITKFNQKGKIEYGQITSIDWNAKVNELKAKVDTEALKAKLGNKKYYQSMFDSYKAILLRAKDPSISISDKIADIVLFNENFTNKWSKTNNNLQLLLTYEFCKIFNK